MNYLIPANTKSGQLILGIFKPFDLILLGTGVLISLVMLMTFPMSSNWQVVIVVLPGLISAFLVIPVPNYHNILTIIIECYNFFTNRRNYIWKGWCVKDVEDIPKETK